MSVIMRNGQEYGGVDDGLLEDVAELKTDVSELKSNKVDSSAFTTQGTLTKTDANADIDSGGYVRVGNIVIVAVKVTVNAQLPASTRIIAGLPTVSNGFALPMMGINHNFSVRASGGQLYTNQITPADTYWISGAYVVY